MSFDVSLSKIPEGISSLLAVKGDQLPLCSLADVKMEVDFLFGSNSRWTAAVYCDRAEVVE